MLPMLRCVGSLYSASRLDASASSSCLNRSRVAAAFASRAFLEAGFLETSFSSQVVADVSPGTGHVGRKGTRTRSSSSSQSSGTTSGAGVSFDSLLKVSSALASPTASTFASATFVFEL